MSLCVSCGRSLPCGCPDPRAAEAKLTDLFGLVCPECDAYNEPSRTECVDCSAFLDEHLVPASAIDTVAANPAPRASPSAPAVSLAPAAPQPPPPARPLAPQVTDPIMAPEADVEEIADGDLELVEGAETARPLPPELMPQPWTMNPPGRPPEPPRAPIKTPIVNPLPLIVAKSGTPAGASPPPSPSALLLTQQAAVKPVQLLNPTPAQPLGRACTRCGTTNPPDYKFCGSCGAPLAHPDVPVARSRQVIAPGRASARVLRGERLGQVLPLGMQATVGRGTCELSFPRDPFLSAAHCSLVFDHGRLLLRDHDSSSGTFVRIYEEENLGPGDLFAVGDHLLRFAGPLPVPVAAEDGTKITGGPRPPSDAVKIEEVHEGTLAGRTVVRRGPALVLGRDEGCDVSFPGDRFVSSRHCTIAVGSSGRARIKDLGSTNGTFLRMAPGAERELFKGDCVRIGGEVLQLVET